MSPSVRTKRLNAIRVADALNKIEGVPVSENARILARKWANGEITGEQMKAVLLQAHQRQICIEILYEK